MSPAPPGPRRRARRRPGTEAAFQAEVIGLARFYQWLVYHAPAGGKAGRVDVEQVGRGFPDLVLVKAPRLIFAELKAATGTRRARVDEVAARPEWLRDPLLDESQAAWLEELAAVGGAVALELDERDNRRRHGSYSGSLPARDPGVEVYLWRPSDLEGIVHVLAGTDGNRDAGVAWAQARRDSIIDTTTGGPT